MTSKLLASAFIITSVGGWLVCADTGSAGQISKRDISVHDPSTIVKCHDEYWLFCTGRGIPSCHSKDLIVWERGPAVFTNTPDWVATAVPEKQGNGFWAPDIIYANRQYLLYYSASVFGRNTSAIGLATNPTLDPNDPHYRWVDRGIVVQSVKGDNFNAIDPAVVADTHGGLWLAFGSFWSGIKLIELDPDTGKRVSPDSTVYSLAQAESIEAPCIHRHGDYYYLFVNWGLCCRGTNSTYNIRVGRSEAVTGPYVDKTGVDMRHGGGSLLLETSGRFIGPGHAGILSDGAVDWFSCHFYDGNRGGARTLGIGRLRWDDGWPVLMSE